MLSRSGNEGSATQATVAQFGWLERSTLPRAWRRAGGALALTLAAVLSPLDAQSPDTALPTWIAADPVTRTVTLTLEVSRAAPESTATLNGHHHGRMQLVVPLGWTVKWTWLNRDSTGLHSLVVMVEREKLPAEGGRPALENAMTRAVTTGLKPGQRDVTTFTAESAGWYWMLCGVPGHAIGGEWIGLKVDPGAEGPSVGEK